MSERKSEPDGPEALTAELAELGAALRALRLPAFDEGAARSLFRAEQMKRSAALRAAPPARWRRAPLWASAAALVLSAGTALWVGWNGERRPQAEQSAAVAGAPIGGEAVVFQPLLYAPAISPTQSYSVVRVRIPLSALALGQSADSEATIEADVLVGEDGLASGIRFDPEDTLLISAASR